MAVTPASLSTLTSTELSVVTRAEAAIDAELRLRFEISKAVLIRQALIDFVYDENPRVLDAVRAVYEATGWKIVEYENDLQRWLSFSES